MRARAGSQPQDDTFKSQYLKIEVPGTAAKLRALIAAGGETIVGPFDGR
jgi:hypothetical protein